MSKEDLSEISPIILMAIEVLKKTFGGTDIELLSTEMYRLKPDEYAKAGRLGVDIKVQGVKTFFGCDSMARPILEWGMHIAEQFVYEVLKPYIDNQNKDE